MAGKTFRQGVTIQKLMDLFPTDDTAREWLERQLWPHGPMCPYCDSSNIQIGIAHKAMTHRCRDCEIAGRKSRFSLKTGTVMQNSKVGYRQWVVVLYLVAEGIKGASSMKIHRDLGVSQKAAWYLGHRIRATFESDQPH